MSRGEKKNATYGLGRASESVAKQARMEQKLAGNTFIMLRTRRSLLSCKAQICKFLRWICDGCSDV